MDIRDLNTPIEKWFDVPNTDIQVKLRLPFRNELITDRKTCQTKEGDIIEARWYRQIVTKYLVDVKGLKDGSKDAEYTPEVGLLLMNNLMFGPFIDRMIATVSEWVDLGKDLDGLGS